MRRIFSVTPIHVDPEELERRRRRYAELAPRGIHVELVDAGPAAPRELASEDDLRASERAVSAALAAANDDDALMPDCVLDPGLPESARSTGMLRNTLETLRASRHRITAVTRNAVIGEELARKVVEYGHDTDFLGVAVLDLALAAVSDSAAWNAAMSSALEELAGRGATAVINGCSAVDITRPDAGPAVIDPAETALWRLGARR